MEQEHAGSGDPLTSISILCLGAAVISTLLVSLRYTTGAGLLNAPINWLSPTLIWAMACYWSLSLTVLIVLGYSRGQDTRLGHVHSAVIACIFSLTTALAYSLLHTTASTINRLPVLSYPFREGMSTSPGPIHGSLLSPLLPWIALGGCSLLLLAYSDQILPTRKMGVAYGHPLIDLTPAAFTLTSASTLYLAFQSLHRMGGVLYLLILPPLTTAFLAGWIGLYGYVKAKKARGGWLIVSGAMCLAVAVISGLTG